MTPLKGMRVLDLSRLLPGPYASLLLNDFGAEVIKIEEPHRGDYARWFTPQIDGQSVLHHLVNRGKKSVTLNLKDPRGVAIFLELTKTADVIMESFRPGVLDRLGIGFSVLAAANPQIILCSLTGYGQTGPYAYDVGHDINYLGYSGILALNGTGDGTPVVPSVPIADLGGGGLMAVIGVLLGVLQRQISGKAQWIDVSMLDGVMSWLPLLLAEFHGAHEPTQQSFLLSGSYACYTVYATEDHRYMSVGAVEPKFWETFCHSMGVPEYIPMQFAPMATQKCMKERIQELFGIHNQEYWTDRFAHVDACCTPVKTIREALNDPQVQDRKMVARRGHIMFIAPPIKSVGEHHDLAWKVPDLGQDTAAILQSLGWKPNQITELHQDQVI